MDSDVVIAIETAVVLSKPWPVPGVPDTEETRALRDTIAAQVAALPEGVAPDIPSEWPA